MKLIRQIIIGLAILAAFIIFSVFSIKEYTQEKTNLDSNEDKLPGVNVVLSSISSFLKWADKIPAPELLAVAKTEVEYNTEMAQDIYNNADHIVKNTPEINKENFKDLASITPENIKNTNWQDVFKKVKEALSKDWSQP